MSDTSRTENSSKETRTWQDFGNKAQSKYQSGIRKMMHMMRWYRLEVYNATHNCTRHMMLAGRTHYDVMVCIMDCWITPPERGLLLMPHGDWDGISTDYKFEVKVKMGSDYAKCPDRKWSITGSLVYLNGAPVIIEVQLKKWLSVNNQRGAECSSHGCARQIVYEKHTEITQTESQITYIG